MSTFKQIVEGYAENLSNAAMRGAAPIKRMDEIDSKLGELQTKVRLANNAYDSGFYTEYNSGRHMDTNTRSIEAHKAGNASREAAVSDFSNSINELLNNPNLSTKHLVSIHALVDRIPDNSTLGDKKNKLHRAILSHNNCDDFVRGFHYARTGHNAPWKNLWDE